MKKKIVSLLLVTGLLLSTSALVVSAEEVDPASTQNPQYVFNGVNLDDQQNSQISETNVVSDNSEIVLTRNSDGSVTQTVYDYSQTSIMTLDNNQLNVSEYLPSISTLSSVSTATDEYGRQITSPTENRSGHLMCGYNADSDADIEVYYYGTASLQHYDLLISCAHCVWMPQYADLASDGWASVITFYAGRTGTNTYAATADFTSVSVSQNYVDNTTYYLDDDGNPVASPDFDWDWSIIQIDDDLGSQYGWFGLHGCSETEDGLSVYTVGYPGDKSFGTQWTSSGEITDFASENVVHYDAYIYPGNSGGPLLNDGYVYGITTFYSYNSSTPWLYSGGTRMYDGLFNMIVDARNESAERWE